MGIESLGDMFGGVSMGQMVGQTMLVIKIVVGASVFIGVILFLLFVSKYKTNVMIKDRGIWKEDKAKKISKGKVIEYELKSSMLKSLEKKETFEIEHSKIQLTKKGDLIFLFKQADGAYHPYENDDSNFMAKLRPIPHDSLRWLADRVVQIKQKYREEKWWAPMVPWLSVAIVAIICFMMIVMTLDKVQGIQQFCSGAKSSALADVMQKIK